MTRIDPARASLFRMEWLVPLDTTTEDDLTRAVAEKASVIIDSALFMTRQETPRDMEVRVWVEAACASGCVSITWEPGSQRFGFHLLDETLHERLACIVFDALPCVDAVESVAQAGLVLEAATREAGATRRVPVKGGSS
jgi:hypothetical protein